MLLSRPLVEIIKRDPVSIEVTQSILDAIRLLAEGGFHHLPVVEDGRLVGIISMLDIVKLDGAAMSGTDANLGQVASRACVGEIMFREVIPLSERATLGDAAQLLSSGEYHAVPIIDAGGMLQGIVTTTDLIACMLETPAAPELPEDVRTRIHALEQVCDAAQGCLDSGMTEISREHLEQVIQAARWAA